MNIRQSKFKKGQRLINKKTKQEIIIDIVKTKRLVTKNYSGIVDEFTGEYSVVPFDDKGKQEQIDISEESLLNDFEKP